MNRWRQRRMNCSCSSTMFRTPTNSIRAKRSSSTFTIRTTMVPSERRHSSTQWQSLKGRVDPQTYEEALQRLEYQAGHAIVWRDAICNWFARTSGIPDRLGRVGHYPNRVEAESMTLQGYVPLPMSHRRKVLHKARLSNARRRSSRAPPLLSSLAIPAFMMSTFATSINRTAISRFRVYLDNKLIAEWHAGSALSVQLSQRGFFRSISHSTPSTLKAGDEFRVEGPA